MPLSCWNWPLGVFIGVLLIGLAAFALIMDFTSIEAGVRAGAPQRFAGPLPSASRSPGLALR